MSKDIWRKDYEAYYKMHRQKDKSVYKIEWCREFVLKYTEQPNTKKTLLDVGCGDGVWSIVLSEWFEVLGVDNSKEGIHNAEILKEKHRSTARFSISDIRRLNGLYDVVFCRCPEFFGGYAPNTDIFQEFLPVVIDLCRETLYFIVYSKPPFGRYYNKEKTSYFHDPEEIDRLLSKYGNVYTIYESNYIVTRLNKPSV